MTRKEQLIHAIVDGIRSGGDTDNWNAPEFADAVKLTGEWGCQWDFEGWSKTLDIVHTYDMLGGADLVPYLAGTGGGSDNREFYDASEARAYAVGLVGEADYASTPAIDAGDREYFFRSQEAADDAEESGRECCYEVFVSGGPRGNRFTPVARG
jgi:hypothetical protein